MDWIVNIWQKMPPDVQTLLKWFFDKHLGETLTLIGMFSFLPKIVRVLDRRKSERDLRKRLPDYPPQVIKRNLKYYVWPNCQSIDPCQRDEIRNVIAVQRDLASTLDQSFRTDAEFKHYILLADSGMGKTSFLLNYFSRHLRKFHKRFRMELIPLNVPGLKERLDKIQEKNKTILLLDALDEDTEAIRNHHDRLEQIMNWTRDFYRILITCRTQFFPRDEEIPEITGIAKVAPREPGEGRQYTFNKIYLSPFTEEQVTLYLKKRFPFWQKNKQKSAVAIVDKIPNLAVRPMLLAYVDDLIKSDKTFTNSYQIYREMVDAWLGREKTFVHDKEILRKFSDKLAVDLFMNRKSRGGEMIRYEDLEPLAEQYGLKLESWQMASRSLLNRDAVGNYKFAHRSILEFLLADYIIGLGVKAREDVIFLEMTEQIRSFVKEGYGRIDWRCPLYYVSFQGEPFKFQNKSEMNLQPFEMAIYPVTNIEYEEFYSGHKEKRDKYSDQDEQPVVRVSWDDANHYCKWLSQQTGIEYRLPTEAEWEYAASGGGKRKFPWGNEQPTPYYTNYSESKIGETTQVGTYEKGKTPEGLYDMAGNVWEWCQDRYDERRSSRVLRGGSFVDNPGNLRCSYRYGSDPIIRVSYFGFRVVRALQL